MEKIKKYYSKPYPMLRLFKQDIEQLLKVFQENCKKVEICAEGYKLDDICEMDKIKKEGIVNFSISGMDPHLSLDLSEHSARLYLSDEDDITLRGLESKIDLILSPRKRRVLSFFGSFWMILLLPAMLGLAIASFPFREYKVQGATLIIFIILLYVLSFKMPFKKYSLIYWADTSLAHGFFRKNKENILIAIISAFFGAVITVAVSWLSKLF